ncbi:cell division protein CrgA [Gardnerella vaginalis]|uniref:Cell division protein CrgA n=1 Tax=Gardnerella vaginalis TaxID=2702 RepID=A0A133NNZ9_GARVA|nr:cell division protein CrgA [Gardnerella vaginalis]KXA18026.1 putative septation inhibitor protein [Gardnerella vaginalis]MDK7191842.1 cell division protein CrgA [Bifidobacterium sp. UMB1197]
MADEELNKLNTTSSADVDEAQNSSKEDVYGVPMEQVEAVLNATADKESLSPQIQRMMKRQEENTRRVEEAIKGTKANAGWFVPLFCTLMIVGLFWAVVYYLNPSLPIPGIGAFNLLIAACLVMAGFLMTMCWR